MIVYVMDALRVDGLDLPGSPATGHESRSPTIARLAHDGHVFLDHRSTASNTLLSVRHLFSGELSINEWGWHNRGSKRPSLAELFREAGYRTGLFSGNGYLSARFGLTKGFDHVSKDALFRSTVNDENGVNRNAERVQSAALSWIREAGAERPIFVYLQTIHPHNPYSPPEPWRHRFVADGPSQIQGTTPVLIDIQRGRRTTSPADRARLRSLYDASIAYNDAEISLFLEEIRKIYPDREIFFVLTADHGEELFDHGGVLHGYTLYEEQLRIPLVLWSPSRVPGGGTTAATTDSLDVRRTLIAIANHGSDDLETGRDLLPLVNHPDRDGSRDSRIHFSAAEGVPGGLFAARFGRWKLMWARGTNDHWKIGVGHARSWDREFFFDLESDPRERHNLAGFGGAPEAWLRLNLREWVGEKLVRSGPAGNDPADEPMDRETEDRLRALGYLD